MLTRVTLGLQLVHIEKVEDLIRLGKESDREEQKSSKEDTCIIFNPHLWEEEHPAEELLEFTLTMEQLQVFVQQAQNVRTALLERAVTIAQSEDKQFPSRKRQVKAYEKRLYRGTLSNNLKELNI